MALNFPNNPTNGETHTENNITWIYNSTSTTWQLKEGSASETGKTRIASVKDVKGNTDPGGQIIANTWTTRDLNTISDPGNIGITVTDNKIKVPAGTYKITWKAPGWRLYTYQTKLEYSTDSTFATGVTKVIGSSEFSSSLDSNNVSSTSSEGLLASVTFTQQTYVRIRQWAGVTGPTGVLNGLGVASYNDVASTSSGESSIYTTVEIEDLATAIKESEIVNTGKSKLAKVEEVGTNHNSTGGQFPAAAWTVRTLTNVTDPHNIGIILYPADPSNNIDNHITVPAGTYSFRWSAPAMNVDRHVTRLLYSNEKTFSFESAITTAVYGSVAFSENDAGNNPNYTSFAQTKSTGFLPSVTFTETKYITVEHYSDTGNTSATDAMGVSSPYNNCKPIWTTIEIEDLATAAKNIGDDYVAGTTKVAILKDEKNFGTTGGDFNKDGWRDRDLTEEEDPQGFVSFVAGGSKSQKSGGTTPGYWSLPAGTYKIEWNAPAFNVNRHKSRLVWSTTLSEISSSGLNASDYEEGSNANTTNIDNSVDEHVGTVSSGYKVITTTAENTYFKILHWCTTTKGDNGLGVTNSPGGSYNTGPEIYTQVRIEDLKTAVKEGTGGGGTSLGSRTTKAGTTSTLAANASADLNITGAFKSYALLKIAIDHPAWVVLYTNDTTRTADDARAEGTDPDPGSGILAEVLTTTAGGTTFVMTPGLIGWNDDGTPTTTIYAKVKNKDSSSRQITVTLTIIQLEA